METPGIKQSHKGSSSGNHSNYTHYVCWNRSIYVSMYQSMYLYINLCIILSIYPFWQSIYLCLCLYFFPHISFHFFYPLSTSLTPPQSVCPRVLDRVRPCCDRLLLCSFLFFRTPLTSPGHRRVGEKEEWSGVGGGGMDLLTWGSGSGRCIRVWIMVDDEASWCQGQLHTGRATYTARCSSLWNLCHSLS